MVDLIDVKNLFKRWSYTKEEVKTKFDEQMSKLKYENGRIYLDK